MEIVPWAATLDHHCAGARKGLLSSFLALLALACEPVKRHSARRCFLKDPAFILSSWPTLRHHHLPLATCRSCWSCAQFSKSSCLWLVVF